MWSNKVQVGEGNKHHDHAGQVPEAHDGKGVSVRVVAGTALGISSPIRTITPTYYLGMVTILEQCRQWQMDNTIMDGWDLLMIMVAFREFTSRSLTDFRIKAGGKHVQEIPEGWTAFVYTLLVPNFWDEIFMRQSTVFHTYLLIIRGHLSSATCQFKFSSFCTQPIPLFRGSSSLGEQQWLLTTLFSSSSQEEPLRW